MEPVPCNQASSGWRDGRVQIDLVCGFRTKDAFGDATQTVKRIMSWLLHGRPFRLSLQLLENKKKYFTPYSFGIQVSRLMVTTAGAPIPTTVPSHLEDDGWQAVPATGSSPTYHVYTKPIQKSAQDDREYRVIRLQNGLEVVLVHDATADKAAASMNVAVGHLSDPVSILFLKH